MANQSDPEEENYMGDLSLFLPPETSRLSKLPTKKLSDTKTLSQEPSKKKPKNLNWQHQRRLDRERKQRDEDEKTLENMSSAIPQSNIGFKMLKQMGYSPGSALGKDGSGRAEPVRLEIRRSRAGIGKLDPLKENLRNMEARAEKERKTEEGLMVEFGWRQKSQWRSRRIVVNFSKAKAVLDQLENREIVEIEEDEEEEEEEEEITEEDLQNILTKLRDEHSYCLFCGCQYESMEALLSNCPGINEDDH